MDFSVVFNSSLFEAPLLIPCKYHGTVDVDFIRNELGLKDLPLECIKRTSAVLADNKVKVMLEEQTARRCGLFEETNTIEVVSAPGFLNQFAIKKVSTEKGPDGSIKWAQISWKLDSDAVLLAWADAGYPTRWGFDSEE